MATATRPITAEEFARMPPTGVPTEPVRGEIVEMHIPKPRHGQVTGNIYYHLRQFAESDDLGHVVCNDAAIVVERDPDTVRRGDVWFIRYQKVPKGPLPWDCLEIPPDMVVEVKSEFDRWSDIHLKVAEYVNAGVAVVCVLDPDNETARLYFPDQPDVFLDREQDLTFPDLLPGFTVKVRVLFE